MNLPITIELEPEQHEMFDKFIDFMLSGKIAGIKTGDKIGIVYKRTNEGAILQFTGDVEYELKRLPDPNVYAIKVTKAKKVFCSLFAGSLEIKK